MTFAEAMDHVAQAFEVIGAAVLLAGLEILVAADLVRTVAVEPTLDNVVILGGIVLIRTVLSFSLDVEIEGVAPWRRAAMTGAGHIARAAADPGRPVGGATVNDHRS